MKVEGKRGRTTVLGLIHNISQALVKSFKFAVSFFDRNTLITKKRIMLLLPECRSEHPLYVALIDTLLAGN